MSEKPGENSKPDLEEAEIKRLLENSQQMVELTKAHIFKLDEDIERQEELLTRQRKELNDLLEELGFNKN
jgi:hypothetical protein